MQILQSSVSITQLITPSFSPLCILVARAIPHGDQSLNHGWNLENHARNNENHANSTGVNLRVEISDGWWWAGDASELTALFVKICWEARRSACSPSLLFLGEATFCRRRATIPPSQPSLIFSRYKSMGPYKKDGHIKGSFSKIVMIGIYRAYWKKK